MNTIFCPLFKKEVDAIWCIEITDVANGLIKKRVLPDCILRIKNFKVIWFSFFYGNKLKTFYLERFLQ